LAVLPFAGAPVSAETDEYSVDASDDFELAADELADAIADGGFELDNAEFAGNPMQRIFKSWPEDLVVAPIPGRSPQFGFQLTAMGGYFLGARDEDAEKRPSVIGGFGMFSANGSYAFGAGGNFHFLDDRLRVQAGAGYADIRYKFYGFGDFVVDKSLAFEIEQEAPLYYANAKWRLWNGLYAGIGLVRGDVETRARVPLPPEWPADLTPSFNLDLGALWLPVQFDTRDHEQFPRRGWLIDADTKIYRDGFGSDFEAETYKLALNHYRGMRARDALALRLVVKGTGGNAPFFLLSSFGSGPDLRGYPAGRYRDKLMYALQGEYRWHLHDSWILTGFVGVGEVADEVGDFGDDFLPAAGVGARYVLSKKHRVSISADLAVGKHGAEFYIGIGEAF
jgi:outer membrane protein assembly factor BamA